LNIEGDSSSFPTVGKINSCLTEKDTEWRELDKGGIRNCPSLFIVGLLNGFYEAARKHDYSNRCWNVL